MPDQPPASVGHPAHHVHHSFDPKEKLTPTFGTHTFLKRDFDNWNQMPKPPASKGGQIPYPSKTDFGNDATIDTVCSLGFSDLRIHLDAALYWTMLKVQEKATTKANADKKVNGVEIAKSGYNTIRGKCEDIVDYLNAGLATIAAL